MSGKSILWAWVLVLSAGLWVACGLDEPLTGRPCDDDRDCAGPEPHYCANDRAAGIPQVCVPGRRPALEQPNRAPIIGTNVAVLLAGGSVTQDLAVTDPDGDAVRFSLVTEPEGNFGSFALDNKSFSYTAQGAVDGVVRDLFRMEVSDGQLTVAFNVLVVVIGAIDADRFSTWTGALSEDFHQPGNWNPPGRVPDETIDVLVPMAERDITGGAIAQARSVYVTSGAQPALFRWVTHGPAVVASGPIDAEMVVDGVGPAANLAGTFRALTLRRDAMVESSVQVWESLVQERGTLQVEQGTTLSVGGDLTQLTQAGDIVFAPAASDLMFAPPTLVVEGRIQLSTNIVGAAGRVMVGAGLRGHRLRPDAGIVMWFGRPGQSTVDVPAGEGAFLRRVEIDPDVWLETESDLDVRGDLLWRGTLSPAEGTVVRVLSTLFVDSLAQFATGPVGGVFANACEVSAQVTLPAYVTCLDGGLDAGPVWDAGGGMRSDAGADAGDDAGRDAGSDGGQDAGVPADAGDAGEGGDAGPSPGFCGDGVLDDGEQCDDGNVDNLDGCRNDCLLAACGDGLWQLSEGCDDGNLASGDGCDADCAVETGHTCVGASDSVCAPDGDVTRFPSEASSFTSAYAGTPAGGILIIEPGVHVDSLGVNGKDMTIVADPGTLLVDDVAVRTIGIKGGANVTIIGLTIASVDGTAVLVEDGHVVLREVVLGPSAQEGLNCLGDSSVSLTRSMVNDNAGVGVRLSCTGGTVVEANIITRNGLSEEGTEPRGAALIETANGVFNFNTVVDNFGRPDEPSVHCVDAGEGAMLEGNIFWGNGGGQEVGASCTPIGNTIDEVVPQNVTLDCGVGPPAYRLDPGSPCVDQASATPLVVDIDGEARPRGPAPDFGADEAQ